LSFATSPSVFCLFNVAPLPHVAAYIIIMLCVVALCCHTCILHSLEGRGIRIQHSFSNDDGFGGGGFISTGFNHCVNKGEGSCSGSGWERGHNISLRVAVTLICIQIFPIPLSGFVKVGARGVGNGNVIIMGGNDKWGVGGEIDKQLQEMIPIWFL
jgi:hypothetical protein